MLKDRRVQFVILFALAFSLIPLFRNVIPYDMIEDLYWGKELQLGYAKHPPLFAWVSYIFFLICGSIPESMYLLTQLNLLLGCYFIFRIARFIGKDKDAAISSVLFFLCSAASVFGNTKFNATTILISLLPIIFYIFLRMMRFQKVSDAVWLGFFAMLACIGKYFALLFLGCMGLFMICDKECRKMFFTSLPYVAVGTFLLSISWHVWWLTQNNFITLQYGLEKSVSTIDRYAAFNFILMTIVFFSTSFLALRGSMNSTKILKRYREYTMEESFVLFITVVPSVILFCVSVVTGMSIGSFWGVNMLMLLGVCFSILYPDINHKKLFRFSQKIFCIFAVIMVMQLGIGRYFWKFHDETEAIDPHKVVHCIENDWYNHFGDKKISELHADKATAFLHIYLNDSPRFYDPKTLSQFGVFDTYDNDGISLVTFLGNEKDRIQFISKYSDKIISIGKIHVINSFVYYAFLKGRK